MNFDEALNYMQGLRRFGIKLGNERFAALLARLGNPHLRYGVAHVTGTKGKGSTTAFIANILQRHGFRVGGYYSPYVFDVRERAQVDGQMIPREDFARLVTAIRPRVDALAESELGQATEFELKTAVGFAWFAEQEVDFAAVEVGLGGRLDATNVVAPLATVITNVGLDHTHILGDTHAKIAWEKAGIIKPGVPCITAAEVPEALEVIRTRAAELGAPLLEVRHDSEDAAIRWRETGGTGDMRPEFEVQTPRNRYAGLRSGLLGAFQQVNAACAIGAVEQLSAARGFAIQPDAVREGIARTFLPGRMQIVRRGPTLLLDGAHNAIAAQALRDELVKMERERLLLVIGMVAGHEPRGVVDVLAPLAARVYATQPTWSKGLPAEEIARAAQPSCPDVRIFTPPHEAARQALAEAGPNDLVVVTGSFYVVGDVNPAEFA
jgi:dihydrofolate synthase/folylpolyglutamate synthase